jgi:putative endonuclease
VKRLYVYILANHLRSVLYIGITNDLARRLAEHRLRIARSFTARYRVWDLVYVEDYLDPRQAICREKQLKRWSRAKKNALVEVANPEWRDLSDEAASESVVRTHMHNTPRAGPRAL